MSTTRKLGLGLFGIGVFLLCTSVLLSVLALRSLALSELVSFAAAAYILVPLGSRLVFGEKLTPRFGIGAVLIILGIVWIHA